MTETHIWVTCEVSNVNSFLSVWSLGEWGRCWVPEVKAHVHITLSALQSVPVLTFS